MGKGLPERSDKLNLRGWMDDILSELSDDPEVTLTFIKKRVKYPYAAVGRDKDIHLFGNTPSLARLGIAHLLGHELAHLKHLELFGVMGEDDSPLFQKLEHDLINRIWELCLQEHEV